MLRLLNIDNLAVVDHLEMEFARGLNVLTGETGSGKSIIIDAVELLLGGRASPDSIRTGADRASVQGVFDIEENLPLIGLFDEAGIAVDDGEIIIRREVSRSARGRIFVNNQNTTASLLRTIQPHLLDIHGQGDQQSLTSPATHLLMLDLFAGLLDERSQIEDIHQRLLAITCELELLAKAETERARELDYLQHQISEIEDARLREDEDLDLETERTLLSNSGRVLQLCSEAYDQLYDNEHSVVSLIGAISRRLEELGAFDRRLQAHAGQLESARYSLEEVSFALRDYLSNVQVSPKRLEEVEERLALVERLKRKYGGSIASVGKAAVDISQRLKQLDESEEARAGHIHGLEGLLREYSTLSGTLSQVRQAKGVEFENAVLREVVVLALENARFEVRFSPSESASLRERLSVWATSPEGCIGRHGAEDAEFFFSANPGEDSRPLSSVASGGELSRLMLAIKTIVAPTPFPRTLIFDEIDAGIGGRVSDAVGVRLKRLAVPNQVLCVTHQAQIARYADHHFLITKEVAKDRTKTSAARLSESGRIEELARMLGGREVTALARKHARELVRSGQGNEEKR